VRFHRFPIAATALLAAVALAAALGAIGVAVLSGNERSEDIQASRAENVLSACREQNARHDATVTTLDQLLADAAHTASPARRRQLAQSRTSTVLLIDALAPKRDCLARVRELVGDTD